MADGKPKDYSSMYCEDSNNSFSILRNHNDRMNYSQGQPDIKFLQTPPLPPPPMPFNRNSITASANNKANNLCPSVPTRMSTMRPTQNRNTLKSLDGSHVAPKHREQSPIDLMQVVAKLEQLPKENHRAYAMDTLNKHYSSVFNNRKRPEFKERVGFRVYIQYSGEKDTYVVKVERNTLRAIKDKMPKRGNYRYFFRSQDSTCEELEFDDSIVPHHDVDGQKQIYCQVFPI